jgi:hypothetical protein
VFTHVVRMSVRSNDEEWFAGCWNSCYRRQNTGLFSAL